jgi:hypothetical protein
MATYVVRRDEYAGWDSTGKYFAGFGLAAGLAGLTGWAAIHRHLPGWQPVDAAGQLAAVAMAWVGCGLSAVMAVAALGSLRLSGKARGTVTVDDVGVLRQIGGRRVMLRWEEIEGFVALGYGGVTLIAREGRERIEIPRLLDDYRGFTAELRARGLESLPARRLRRRWTWKRAVQSYAFLFAYLVAYEKESAHAVRVVGLVAWLGYSMWLLLHEEQGLEERGWTRWVSAGVLVAMAGWVVRHMAHTW